MTIRNRYHVVAEWIGAPAGTLLLGLLAAAPVQSADETPKARPARDLPVPKAAGLYEERYQLPVGMCFDPARGCVVGAIPEFPVIPARAVAPRAAARAGSGAPVPGQVITHLNGEKLTSTDQVHRLLAAAKGEFTVRVAANGSAEAGEWKGSARKVQGPVRAAEAGPAADRKVHFLLIADTNDRELGPSVRTSLANLAGDIQGLIPEPLFTIQTVDGDNCTAEKIVNRVLALNTGPDDAIICYYMGHGAYDRELGGGDPARGHFFQLTDGDLLRQTLFEHLLARPGRLKVLLSDSCNVPARPRIVPRALDKKEMSKSKDDDGTIRTPTSFERLVRYHTGVVDLNSSSVDQFSWYTKGNSGWFTFTFCRQMNATPDWPKFLTDLSGASNKYFQQRKGRELEQLPAGAPVDAILMKLKEQEAMTVSVYQLALTADPPVEEPRAAAVPISLGPPTGLR